MKEEIIIRMQILRESGVISETVEALVLKMTDIILEQKGDVEADKINMFATHAAMAGQRVLDGSKEASLEEEVLNELKEEPVYQNALVLLETLEKNTEFSFPQSEQGFLIMHLCNILS